MQRWRLRFPLMNREQAQFFEQAMAASAPAQALAAVIKSAQPLIEAGADPGSSAAEALVNELTAVCAQHGLGDPETEAAAATVRLPPVVRDTTPVVVTPAVAPIVPMLSAPVCA